jgi:hypothetical protein
MSFLVIMRKYLNIDSPTLVNAIAKALRWIKDNKRVLPTELAVEYKEFFKYFNVNEKLHTEQDLVLLF